MEKNQRLLNIPDGGNKIWTAGGRGGVAVLCEKAAGDKIGLERSFSCSSGELARKKVGSLIRLSQTYPSSASGNHPMAGTHFFSYFHQPSYTLSLCYKAVRARHSMRVNESSQ